MTLAQDNIIDIFLLNPCDELFDVIDNQNMALKLLRKQEDSAQKLYFLHSKGDKILRQDIVKEAINENNEEIFYTIVDSVQSDDGSVSIMKYCAKYGRLEMLKYLLDIFPASSRSAPFGGTSEYDDLAMTAAENGYTDIVRYIFQIGVEDIDKVASAAAKGGQRDLLNILIEGIIDVEGEILRADDWSVLATGAAQGGYKDLFDDFVGRGGRITTETARLAALSGSLSLLPHVIDSIHYPPNTQDLNRIAYILVRFGDMDIVLFIIKEGANNYIEMAKVAAKYGHRDLVKFLLKKAKDYSLDDVNSIAYFFVKYNKIETDDCYILDDMIKVGANDWNSFADAAALQGNMKVLVSMIERSESNNWNNLAKSAKIYGHIDILDYLIEMGATDIECINYSVVYHGRVDILEKTDVFSEYETEILIDLALKKGCRSVVDFFFDRKREERINSFMSCL